MPKISVLINNYNYGRYLGEAVKSVLTQDYNDFELIVVDDGSTDNSLDVLESFHDPRLKKISKPNGGQLSAFNAGFLQSTGEILCFLDSDDCYLAGYLQTISDTFNKNPDCGCIFSPMEYFGTRSGTAACYPPGYLGCNPFSTAARHIWIGVATSAFSIRRQFAEKFLPYEAGENYWKTRADDLLIWGADLVSAVKFALDKPMVRYRIHGNNLFWGKKRQNHQSYILRKAAAKQFCDWVMTQNDLHFEDLLCQENEYGTLSFVSRTLSWLKIGRDRMVSRQEWLRCGKILLTGLYRRNSLTGRFSAMSKRGEKNG